MSVVVQIRRGSEKCMCDLQPGELGFVANTGHLLIGGIGGNIRFAGEKIPAHRIGIRNGNIVCESVTAGRFRVAILPVAGDTPTPSECISGRLIVNTADGILYCGNGTDVFAFRGAPISA